MTPRQETLIDSLFLLSIILISFGAGMQVEEYIASNNYLPLLLYAGLLVLGFKQLVLDNRD